MAKKTAIVDTIYANLLEEAKELRIERDSMMEEKNKIKAKVKEEVTKFVKKIDKETKYFKVDMNKGYQGYVSTYDDDCFANMAIDGRTMHLPAPKNIEKIATEMYDIEDKISKIGSKILELESIALDPELKKKIKLLAGKYTSEYDDLRDVIAKITDTLL